MEKNSLMMLTEKGYALKNKFPKYMDTHESKGERKLPPIIEKYIDTGAKIQEPRYGLNEIHEGPHIKYSNPLHEVASFTESMQDTQFLAKTVIRTVLVPWASSTHLHPFLLYYYFMLLLLPLCVKIYMRGL